MRVARLCLGALSLLTLGGACSPDTDSRRSDPTTSSAAGVTTTTDASGPFVVPSVINEAYVNRVLDAIGQVEGDAIRQVVSARSVEPKSVERIRSIYDNPQYGVELQRLLDLLDPNAIELVTPPGNYRRVVRELLVARPDCIIVRASLDLSDVVKEPPTASLGELESIILHPKKGNADPKSLNPTPWSMSFAVLEFDPPEGSSSTLKC